jgi:hypothetical protein
MKLVSKNLALIVLAILLGATLGFAAFSAHRQHSTNSRLEQDINTLMQNQVSLRNGMDYQQVTVSPSDSKIYLPQLAISLPLTQLGAALVYSPHTAYVTGSSKTPTGPNDEAAISTFNTASASQSQAQFNCSELVRIKLEAKPNAYSPHEIPSGSVSLANGKTLQIYKIDQKDCQPEWTATQADPAAVAKLFKQAQSY